jgi:Tfp pilus tip-associated adhesin PilY1
VPVDLDGGTMANFTSNTSCATTLGSSLNGWYMDLNAGRGEQTVTSAMIFGGLVFFSTNRPVSVAAGQCGANLGEARGYAVNLLNASGAVNTEALCGGDRSGVFLGGGLPPSPVVGRVMVGTRPVTVMIGGIQRSGGASSPIGAQRVRPVITQKRLRTYWYTHGDK